MTNRIGEDARCNRRRIITASIPDTCYHSDNRSCYQNVQTASRRHDINIIIVIRCVRTVLLCIVSAFRQSLMHIGIS